MIYLQHINRESQAIDHVIDVVKTPEQAADVFEDLSDVENYNYDRKALVQSLSNEKTAYVQASGQGSYYVMFDHVKLKEKLR